MIYKLYKTPDGKECAMIVNQNGSVTSFSFDQTNTDYANFKKDLADGAELQDAEGNVIDGIAYLATLES
jgi:hypothetical protein